ncbi:MAG: outer membrane protein assembly factor BamB [Gammaproteobacteria bacterium]|nr:outer membrane protein assembly factor BamB [Gammaproteobacteria bacterium]MDH5650824.1 outer membrane protein assembly factor BamB [Gammaproteobacteria bacterium]
MMRNSLILFSLLVLGACSSTVSSVAPPVALQRIDAKLVINKLWHRQVGRGASDKYLKLNPVITDKIGYVVDHTGYFIAWDLVSGKKLWSRFFDVPASSAPGMDDDRLYFGTGKGEVFSISPKDGKLLWRSTVSSEVLSPPVSNGKYVVVRTVDGRLHTLDKQTGKVRWVHDRNMPVLSLRGTSTPIIEGDIVISGADNGKLTALVLESGSVLWETAIAVPQGRSEIERLVDIDAQPLVRDGVIYTVTYQGRLAAVKIDTGRILWVRDMSSYNGMEMDAHRIYLTDADGVIWALDRFNGATLWKQDGLLRRVVSRPALQGRYLVVGDFNGYLHWLKRNDGNLVGRTRLGAETLSDMNSGNEDDDREFSKLRNILATPVIQDDITIAVNRAGLLSAFRIKDK